MDTQLKISLVIPVKNEENSIRILLDSLKEQTRQPDEIIITDGGSIDKTVGIIESYINNGMHINLIRTQNASPGKGRNLAIQSSNCEWIAMTDAGIRLDRNWLKELIRLLEERRDLDGVYGSYEPIVNSFFKECLAIVFVAAPKVIKGRKIRSHSIASILLRRDVWKTVEGFPDFRAAEDRIFMEKVENEGFRIGFSPEAKVFWDIPYDFKSTFKRFSIFSMHDIKAGRFMDWHRGVILMYIWGGVLAFLGIAVWPFCYLLLLLSVLLRASNLMREKLKDVNQPLVTYVKRLILVTVIMIWVDIAMFWGMIKYAASKLQKRRET